MASEELQEVYRQLRVAQDKYMYFLLTAARHNERANAMRTWEYKVEAVGCNPVINCVVILKRPRAS